MWYMFTFLLRDEANLLTIYHGSRQQQSVIVVNLPIDVECDLSANNRRSFDRYLDSVSISLVLLTGAQSRTYRSLRVVGAHDILLAIQMNLDRTQRCAHAYSSALVAIVKDVRLRDGSGNERRGQSIPDPCMEMSTQAVQRRRRQADLRRWRCQLWNEQDAQFREGGLSPTFGW